MFNITFWRLFDSFFVKLLHLALKFSIFAAT